MNFQFCFNGTPLEPHEAIALFEASSNAPGKSKPTIELNSLIDSKNLSASKLFELAVNNKSQELASLAWKISVQQDQPRVKSAAFSAPKAKTSKPEQSNETLEDIIEYLNQTNTYTSLGVAMLLTATHSTEWVTLRQTAIHFVNEVICKKPHLITSKFLRGFEWDGERYMPVDLSSGRKRRDTFHVAPLYIALREGLVYCKEHGLVDQVKLLSIGAPYSKNDSPSVNSTRRMYYKIKASERGQDLIKMWADLDRYLEKNFDFHAAS